MLSWIWWCASQRAFRSTTWWARPHPHAGSFARLLALTHARACSPCDTPPTTTHPRVRQVRVKKIMSEQGKTRLIGPNCPGIIKPGAHAACLLAC